MVMKAFHIFFIIFYFLVSLPPFLKLSSSAQIDTITSIQSITDHRSNTTTLVSPGQTFELGFFSPGNSKNRYIGIWYKIAPDKVVWVANRDKPLTDLNGEFTIKNGNLVLFDRRRSIVWSSNVSSDSTKDRISLLLDSGNLVLKGTESLTEIFDWQSFDYPTDTLLPGMKVGWDLKTGLERYLTSWRNANDPSTGNVTFRMILNGLPRGVLEMKSIKKYRTGTWNGIGLSGVNFPSATVARIFDVVDEKEVYMAYEPTAHSVLQRIKISYSGFGEHLILRNGSTEWTVMYTLPTEQLCESYGYCGDNAICKSNGSPICDCLKGYTPRSQDEWRKMNWSEGCMRKIPLDCNQKAYGFLKIPQVKLPDLLDFWLNKTMNLKDCEEACLKNCSCAAYANSDVRNGGSGCLMWFGDLVDIRDMHIEGSEQDIYVRLSASEIKSIRAADKRKRLTIIVASSMTFGMCTVGIVFWCITLKLRNRPAIGKFNDEDIELPMFDLATIIAATSNFSQANKIGAGGFGPVYKGKLPTGQEIAVKRLSKSSGQGIKEFKNEIELIAKLQHRNLVALLGYCIHGEERILIYEYMPKKSLDHFIFDTKQNTSLPWKKNFDIIRGIARGLLYLHQDSKLNIIHRDLKASNILLDDNLNPKISDFGLARIFREDEKEARTRRVVGTYGYMSPEYAIDGKFSIKSDVFSFGVVLLETVSRKKNRNFRHPNHHHNLLGHAWLLWNEEKALDLMDECFKDSCVESEVLRCIQVGLLCVQKFPHNRPTMSSVVFMLENDGAVLPEPEQPGFFIERSSSDVQRSTPGNHQDLHSENMVTITTPCGR